jgi:molybdate transport system permease protein
MFLTDEDLSAIILTIKLASTVTLILLIICIPIAWWLSQTKSWLKGPISALLAMPLVLPPTVLGFYLLLAMGPNGLIGQATNTLGLGTLAFSFWGLVFGSIIYSMPFVVQPIQNAMEMLDSKLLDTAATLRASPIDRFFTVVLPLSKHGILSATILGFAHTVGEFGLVLMIGGNISDETRVISIQIYDHVEAIDYSQAHTLAGLMVVFSFCILFLLYSLNRTSTRHLNLDYSD